VGGKSFLAKFVPIAKDLYLILSQTEPGSNEGTNTLRLCSHYIADMTLYPPTSDDTPYLRFFEEFSEVGGSSLYLFLFSFNSS
jgi:hypothetical protein